MKRAVFAGVMAVVVFAAAYQYGVAQPTASTTAGKIGIVSIRTVFRDSKINAKYRANALAERSRLVSEEEKLDSEIKAQEAGLKALKVGSPDHIAQIKEIYDKRAKAEAGKQFNGQQRLLRDQRWTEDLYRETLTIVRDLAQKKGLIMVMEVDEPEFPVESADELMMALQTHKVLFSGGCVDLTAEVTAEIDKLEAKLKF